MSNESSSTYSALDGAPIPSNYAPPEMQLGGQALVEGVMMRSPKYVGAAVRRADGQIETRVERFEPIARRIPFFGWPFVRGIVGMVEMVSLGSRYLNWSSELALQDDPEYQAKQNAKKLTDGAPPAEQKAMPAATFALTALVSFGFGFLLFVALPNLLADLVLQRFTSNVALLNLGEGIIKLAIFIGYLLLIGRMKNIRRVFEYHGAEHKVVYAAENGRPLTPDGARPFDTPHPRCGTGFALLTVVVSIFCFVFLPWTQAHWPRVLMRLAMMPLVAGVSYEILKLSSHTRWRRAALVFLTPGMWLQRLTTRQPDDAQLEVSCAAMRAVIAMETNAPAPHPDSPETEVV